MYMIGRVTEVFIPKEYKNGELLDVMDSDKIGFRVMLDDKEVTVVLKQDEFNAKIFRDDIVMVIIDKNTNEFVDIELYDGEYYG